MAEDRIPVPPRSATEQSTVDRLREKQRQVDEAPREDKTPGEAETLAEKKARLAQVLHRGMVVDRLEVKNPDPNKEYEWIRETDQDIQRHFALGFQIELADGGELNRLHGTGDNIRRVGDVVLMSTDKENYELIQQVRTEQKARKSTLGKQEYLRRAGKPGPVQILDPLGEQKKLEVE